MTTAAILCPGPSLAYGLSCRAITWHDYPVIAVNSAANDIPYNYHWLAAGDDINLKATTKAPTDGIVSMDKHCAHYRCGAYQNLPRDLRTIGWDNLPWSMGAGGIAWSCVSAILLAEHLGAEKAIVYGMDLCGDDHGGQSALKPTGGDRRWKREIATLRLLRQQTDARGFQWERIVPSDNSIEV